jgi:hypothetical protein
MNQVHLPYDWTQAQLKCYLKIMFCSELTNKRISQDGIDYLIEWASMCIQFQDFNLDGLFEEFSNKLSVDFNDFVRSCFSESINQNFTNEQKSFILQGLFDSLEGLDQLYFAFLLHDYLFPDVSSGCTIVINMRFHQLFNMGRVTDYQLPNNISLQDLPFLGVEKFKSYIQRVCDKWMENGDFTLVVS